MLADNPLAVWPTGGDPSLDHMRRLTLDEFERKTAAKLDLSVTDFNARYEVQRCDLCWGEPHCDGWIAFQTTARRKQ